MGAARDGGISQSPRVVFPADPVRQAWVRDVGPRASSAHARAANGRRARGAGRSRLEEGGPHRHFGGRRDVSALRRDLSRSDGGPDHRRQLPVRAEAPRLPLGDY